MWRHTPYRETIFLDADTLVAGTIDPLWPAGGTLVLTRFSDWTTATPLIRNRVEKFRAKCPRLVKYATRPERPYPAVNTGVFGFSLADADALEHWEVVTRNNPVFIADEIVMQLIYPHHPTRLLDDRWNASPLYHKATPEDVKVWHFHGHKELDGRGPDVWWPAFCEAWENDTGGIRSWVPPADRELYEV